jgi:NADPH2:quinone reductase
MRAVLCKHWGDPADVTVGEAPDPTLGPRQVLVAVTAAGLNFADTLMIAGKYQEKPPFPFSPGSEVAGKVVAVGDAVTRCRPGERVLAMLDYGGFAERVAASETDVFPVPDEMDLVTAAGFPVTYGTAHGALVWRAGLRPGEVLLVHGAAGGVGLAAVEVGKLLGATVIATAGGPDKLAVAESHGADRLIDYRTEDIRSRVKELTQGHGADVVFDPVGGDVFDASLRCTAWDGRIVVIGFAAGRVPQIPANILLIKNISAVGFYWGTYRRRRPAMLQTQFDDLFRWYREERLRPHISHVFAMDEAGKAMAMMLDRKSTGKVVLSIGQG